MIFFLCRFDSDDESDASASIDTSKHNRSLDSIDDNPLVMCQEDDF